MIRSTGARALVIITVLLVIWGSYLVVERPAREDQTALDWGNAVGFPLLIVAAVMATRFFTQRGTPDAMERIRKYGPREALATGVVWGLVKAGQEYFWNDQLTVAPVISGLVVYLAVLAGNWLLLRAAGPAPRPRDQRRNRP